MDNSRKIVQALNEKIAELSDEDKKILLDYWDNLWGGDYSKELVKDYSNSGKKEKAKTASLEKIILTKFAKLSNEDKQIVADFFEDFFGSEYAKDLVKDYKNTGKKA